MTCLVLAAQRLDHGGELGDVRPVAGVGVPGQRDPAVPGDDQAQPHQPQVGALLLGLAALRDRGFAVRGVDEGGEVRHVQRHRRAVQPGLVHDRQRDPAADLGQVLQRDGVHRVPEPPVIQHRPGNPGEPGRRRLRPPVRKAQLRARRDHPVQRRQRQVGPGAGARVGAPRPGDLVDDLHHAQILQHAPRGGDRAEVLVLDAVRQPQPAAAHRRGKLLRCPQVLLGGDPRLAADPGGLHQVVVGGPAALLTDYRCHIWVIHYQARPSQHQNAVCPGKAAGTRRLSRPRSTYPGNSG